MGSASCGFQENKSKTKTNLESSFDENIHVKCSDSHTAIFIMYLMSSSFLFPQVF